MRCSRCGKCCKQTEILLCKADGKRLERAGYGRKSFVIVDKRGFNHLENIEEYCFSYDKTENCCRAHENRPLGAGFIP